MVSLFKVALAGLFLAGSGCGSQVLDVFGSSADAGQAEAIPGSSCSSGPFVDAGGAIPSSFTPTILSQPVVIADEPPPPISGGTLLILHDGNTAAAADPDRDLVYIADLTATTLRMTVPLMHLDEPGRLVEDAAGRLHVVLRRAGAVVTIDQNAGAVVDRQAVCAAPRGIVYDAATDLVHVACLEGLLVSLPASGGAAVRVLSVAGDLRDVVVDGGSLLVSRFRTADVLTVAADGHVAAMTVLPAFSDPSVRLGANFTPSMAWRMRPARGGGAHVLHQRGVADKIVAQPGGYGSGFSSGCDDIVHSVLTPVHPGQATQVGAPLPGVVLPVDFALSADESRVAVIGAGNSYSPLRSPLYVQTNPILNDTAKIAECQAAPPLTMLQPMGEAVAVAFDGNDRVIVQTREPATLQIPELGLGIPLSNRSRADTGHGIFHAAAGSNVACASCHAEGQEDGRVWSFSCLGGRRTQSLGGGIRGRAPYHWDGSLPDFPALVREVYTGRMSGAALTSDQVQAALEWVDSIPRLPPLVTDAGAVARGAALFNDGMHVGCASCHAGAQLTTDAIVDVGTGGRFKVPSLIGVAWRAPYLHDGCAPTLADRFGTCGGGDQHGVTSPLSASDVADLVAYLKSL